MNLPHKLRQGLCLLLAVLLSAQAALSNAAEATIWQDRTRASTAEKKLSPLAWVSGDVVPASPPLFVGSLSQQGLGLFPGALPTARPGSFLNRPLAEALGALSLSGASVRKISASNPTASQTVVILQDVHLNTEAQSNIAAALKALITKRIAGAVGVEGAFKKFDFRPFRAFPDRGITDRIARAFLHKNLISGVSYAGITVSQDPPAFVGVDDETCYRRNLSDYLEARQHTQLLPQVEQVRTRLARLKSSILNPKLLELDRLEAAHRAGKLAFGAYVEKLVSMAPKCPPVVLQFVRAYRMESELNFQKVDAERRGFLEKMAARLSAPELRQLLDISVRYQSGQIGFSDYYLFLKKLALEKGVDLALFPELDKYIRYVLLTDALRPEQLFSEVMSLSENVMKLRFRNSLEERLEKVSIQTDLVIKLLRFELTPEEWKQYRSNKSSLGGWPPALKSLGIQIPVKENWQAAVSPFEGFYQEADARSQAMVAKLLRLPSAVKVLVVGGFHAPRIEGMLDSAGIPYIVATPRLTHLGDQSATAYLSAVVREKTPLDRIFSGEKLFINPEFLSTGVGSSATQPIENRELASNAIEQTAAGLTLPSATLSEARPIPGREGAYQVSIHRPGKDVRVSGTYQQNPVPNDAPETFDRVSFSASLIARFSFWLLDWLNTIRE